MALPRSVIRIRNDHIEYLSEVERCQYTLFELTRAALRDVGKLICKKFRSKYYSKFKRKKGRVGKYTQYWIRKNQPFPDLLVGIKPFAFYGLFQEIGSEKQPKLGLLTETVNENINNIIEIEGKYLSAIENDNEAERLIDEEETLSE